VGPGGGGVLCTHSGGMGGGGGGGTQSVFQAVGPERKATIAVPISRKFGRIAQEKLDKNMGCS
jgi:hypothetical protein